MFDALSSSVVLPEDITVKAQGCDQVNAWWSPQDKTITLCHDLFQHEVDMFAKALVAAPSMTAESAAIFRNWDVRDIVSS